MSKEPKDRFRVKAYRDAIKAIKNLNYQITSGKQAKEIKGVGAKTAAKIQEIIDTGQLHQVEELGSEQLEKNKTVNLFTGVWGVGPVKAQELWDMGARSIDDIRENYTGLLNDNQQIGLKYYEDLLKRVPRWQVKELDKKIGAIIREVAQENGWDVKSRVCGSYRRQSETCGDMDILLCERKGHGILKALVDRLIKMGILIETLGLGPTKYMGITQTSTGTAFRIDMEVIKETEWPYALLYFTGSGLFNERQRLVAKKMGYSLSEHGLKDVETGEYVKGLTSEREIFEYLGMEYLKPWERKG